MARFNRAAFNPIIRPLAQRMPWLGVVRHRGRRSGRTYRTPVSVFGSGGQYVIALIYGADSDWVENVTAAGGCELEVRGRRVRLAQPRIVHDPTLRDVPVMVRPALRLLRVSDVLHLTTTAPRSAR